MASLVVVGLFIAFLWRPRERTRQSIITEGIGDEYHDGKADKVDNSGNGHLQEGHRRFRFPRRRYADPEL
jgi:hypothetical protein